MAQRPPTSTPSPGAAREIDPPIVVRLPERRTAPIVLASPHSGRIYPEAFLALSRLDALTLRRSEDCFVDELFEGGVGLGLPLVTALFPRAYCDVNREPYELDPHMFVDKLPPHANTRSVRVACGLGTLARVVSDGAEIYRGRIPFAEAERRLDTCYRPYHSALASLIRMTALHFGQVLLLDCHSMPSIGGPLDQDAGRGRADIILGDRYGTSADPRLVDLIEESFRAAGYGVGRNAPYAGGHTTLTYGRPGRGIHAIQIEINRALYMNERIIERGPEFDRHRAAITGVLERVVGSMGDAVPQMAAE